MGKGRAPCCDRSKVTRGPWSPAEDMKLVSFIQKHGHDNWRSLPIQAGLQRCGKSCRLRWINYLSPDVKRGQFTLEEEDEIIKLHESLGNKWAKIASHFPGRTDNEIKNVWNTHLKKRLSPKKTKKLSAASSSCSSNSVKSNDDQNSIKSSDDLNSIKSNDDQNVGMSQTSEPKEPPTTCSSPSSYNSNATKSNEVEVPNLGLEHKTDEPFEIPSLEFDFDNEFWSMLDTFQYNTEMQEHYEGPNINDDESLKWLKDMEDELNLETAAAPTGVASGDEALSKQEFNHAAEDHNQTWPLWP